MPDPQDPVEGEDPTEAIEKDPQEDQQKSLEELAAENMQLKSDLEKEREKEKNFNALRRKTIADLSPEEKEKLMGDDIEAVKQETAELRREQRQERLDDALDALSGGNKDKREKMEFYFNNDKRSDTAMSVKDITGLMKEASDRADLASGVSPSINPITRAANGYSPTPASSNNTRFAETDVGKQLDNELGLSNALRRKVGKGLND